MQVRVAPSIGELEGSPNDVWGTTRYVSRDEPTCFFGLYGLPDFYALWQHLGKKWILWAGSDVTNFLNGYWLDAVGEIKLDPRPLAAWIDQFCESWVENDVEQEALKGLGIKSQVCPSFLGNVDDYRVEYEWSEKPQIYASVSGDDFDLYKWQEIIDLSDRHPDIEFHLYGNTRPFGFITENNYNNVVIHGRVSKEQMNKEVKKMQGGIRLLEHDGFSEVIAKSVLWGQWPVSLIPYPYTLSVDELDTLKGKKEPNTEGRNYFLKTLNRFPWNTK